jgi:hypothetical protein
MGDFFKAQENYYKELASKSPQSLTVTGLTQDTPIPV